MSGTIAVINANVIPMHKRDRNQAIFVKDGIIEKVGTNEEIKEAAAAAGIEPIDAKGATMIPGMYDCHVHMLTTGENATAIDVYDCKDIAEIIDIFKKADEEYEPGRWIYAKRLDESRLAEGRPPVIKEMECIKRPVFVLDRGKHYVLVNRLAYDALGVTKDIKGVRLDEDGEPNGRLQDDANTFASRAFFSSWTDEQRKDAIRFTANLAASRGITTICPQEGLDSTDDDVHLMCSIRDELPIDIQIFWNTHKLEDIKSENLDAWGGDILLDGSIGSRTAAFSEPYCDGDTCGYLNWPDEEVYRIVKEAIENDLIVSFHAIGELAITQALDAMEKALKEVGPEKAAKAKLRLEHFGFPANENDIVRAGKMHLRVSMQSAFTYLRGGPGTVYRSRLGEERESGGYPSRKLLDAGCILGGGSDSDVTPMNSIFGMHAAVNQPYPESSITPYEALRMYTLDAARVTYQDEYKGSLEPGKQGDFVLLDRDPLKIDPTTIKDTQVLLTVHKGDVIFKAE